MIDRAGFVALVDARLASTIERERDFYGHLADEEIGSVLSSIAGLVASGGKRTRPEFAHLGWIAAGGAECAQTVVNIGAALELLHVSALIHDDIIDGARTRRGGPTIHVSLAARHRAESWSGEERRLSEGAALLAGNIAMALADAALGDVNGEARKQWVRVRNEVNIGQYMDLIGAARGSLTPDRIWPVMAMKTAKYTVERPLRMGAAAADPDNEWVRSSLGNYGEMLGLAFQLRDDVLGVFGDPEVTGKPVGDDLREGKTTMLVAGALQWADDAQRRVLSRIGDPTLTDDDVAEIQEVIRATGALADVEGNIEGFRNKAVGSVEHSNLPAHIVEELVRMADRVTRRTS